MALAALCALALAVNLVPEVVFALSDSAPVELGELGPAKLEHQHHNRWVHAAGSLSAERAIRYQRPMESDSYRLAEVEGNPKVWVQVRVPAGEEDPHFVPPASFVGRLINARELSVRQEGLPEAVEQAGLGSLSGDSWILIDGEAPRTMRWVIGVVVLLLAFAVFNVVGILRLARPIRSTATRG